MTTEQIKANFYYLENQISLHFSMLLEKQNEYVLYTDDDIDNDEIDIYIEVRNNITGNVFDVHPIKVNRNGIESISPEGDRCILNLSDIPNIQDKITLCELMEKNIN